MIPSLSVADAPRFAARMSDDRLVEGEQLAGWDRLGGEPRLDDVPLLGESPMRWLLDRHNSPPDTRPAVPHVELWQGDLLPGEVVGFVAESRLPAIPGHLLVAAGAELQPPPTVTRPPVRVVADWVRRIVLAPGGSGPPRPSTLRHRDGRLISFRSIRLEDRQVVALTEEGRQEASWSEVAEINFPRPASLWELHLLQRAALVPGGWEASKSQASQQRPARRLLELQTSDHLRVTTSLERLEHRAASKSGDSDTWVHGAQPVWSLDAIWIPARNVWLRLCYAPHEFPLSRLDPDSYQHRPLVGVARHWRRDRSVHGAPLLGGGRPHAWGLGVHSHSRLAFQLPPGAARLDLGVALDSTSGLGGCVRARVAVNGRTAAESPPLVGSGQIEMITIDLAEAGGEPASASPIELTLEIDAAHQGRPAGADPLDIRDQTNWLDPLLTCDPERIGLRLAELAAQSVPAWEDWTVWSPAPLQWQTDWDSLSDPPGAFRPRLVTEQDVLLHRRLRRRSGQRYLILSVSKLDPGPQASVEVHGSGRLLRRAEVPERSPRRPDAPLIVADLQSLPAGEQTDLTVAVTTDKPVSLRWDALAIVAAHPEYERLYDDEPLPDAVEDRSRSYTGARCLRLTAGKPFRVTFRAPMAFRYRPGPHQSRYLRLAVASPSRSRLAFAVKTVSDDQPFLYDLGRGPLTGGRARRIHAEALDDKWLAVNRDIAGDLKEADVEYIEFFAPDDDGEVLIDQAYVGRGGGGAWSELDTPLQPNWRTAREHQLRAEVLKGSVGPATVGIVYQDGRAAEGIVVDAQHVLTLGETLPAEGAARLTLGDGRQAEGKPLGVDRRGNWALIQWTGDQPLPSAVGRHEHPTLLFNETFFEMGPGGREVRPLQAEPLPSGQIQWVAPPEEIDAPRGRPLVNAAGKAVGLRIAPEAPRYVRLLELSKSLDPMKAGQRTGAWPYGQGPTLGLEVRWGEAGAELTETTPQSRAAGLETGDVLLEVDGRPVRDPWSLHQAVAHRDPGQEVEATYRRGEATREVTLRLGYR